MQHVMKSKRDRGGVLAIVMVILGIIVGIAVLIAMAGWWLWQSAENFPDDVRPEIVLASHQQFVDSIDSVIVDNPSFYQVAAKLENLSFPEELIYLAIYNEPEDGFGMDEAKPVVQKVQWSGHSTSIMNGTGHGTLDTEQGEMSIIVIERPIDNAAIGKYWRAYFPRVENTSSAMSTQ